MIREAQVPLGSAVYSLRAWAYARAVAPTLKPTNSGLCAPAGAPARASGAGIRHSNTTPGPVRSPAGPRRQRRTGARSTAHAPTESAFISV